MARPFEDEARAVVKAEVALRETFGAPPPLAIVLGSGLGPVLEAVEDPYDARYNDLHLPNARVAGHDGTARRGLLGDTEVIVLAGRVHAYEGHAPLRVVRTVRAIARWGVPRLVLTNAAGSLRPELAPGRLVRIVDHLDLTGSSPLAGQVFGEPFPDASRTWTPALGTALDAAALSVGVPLPTGVYAGLHGPAYETAAEVRMLGILGADLVGMSTVHEALAARALDLAVAGVSVVTNHGAGVTGKPVDHASVAAQARSAATDLARLLRAAAPALAADPTG